MSYFQIFLKLFVAITLCIVVFLFIKKKITNYLYPKPPESPEPINSTNGFSISIKPTVTVKKEDTSKYQTPLKVPDRTNWKKYCKYQITGINPNTNRRKKEYVVSGITDSDDIITSKTYLKAPYTIEKLLYDSKPTMNQITYANDLQIIYPLTCDCEDMSRLISYRLEESEFGFINKNLYEYAAPHNIIISPYCSVIMGVCNIMHDLEPNDLEAFILYVIYCAQHDFPIENLDSRPDRDLFYQLSKSDDYEEFSVFIKWLDRHDFEYLLKKHKISCQGNHKKLVTYNKLCDYINSTICGQTTV